MTDPEAQTTATRFWHIINGPNLDMNNRPPRGRATAILRKGEDHQVSWVRIRKV